MATPPLPQPITLWWLMTRTGQPLSLPEQIAAQVAERIITGVITPGAPVTEQSVSEEFAVSRAPVREALRILERQHLVEIHPRRGSNVTLITEQNVRNLTQLRVALYGLIARHLAGIGNPEVVAKLESKMNDLFTFAEDTTGPARFLWGVGDTVRTMAMETGNAYLLEILAALSLETYRYANLGTQTVAQRTRHCRWMRDAVRAIKRLDGEGAAESLRKSAEYARDEALAALAALAAAAPDAPHGGKPE